MDRDTMILMAAFVGFGIAVLSSNTKRPGKGFEQELPEGDEQRNDSSKPSPQSGKMSLSGGGGGNIAL